MAKKQLTENIVKSIIEHPDREEILTKMLIQIDLAEIEEWLSSKYCNPSEKQFIISKKSLKKFQDEYLDMYQVIQQDFIKTKELQKTTNNDVKDIIQGNEEYHKQLEKLVNQELDVKMMLKKMVVAAETRLGQIYDVVQSDPRNIKLDRQLVEWFNALSDALERLAKVESGMLGGNVQTINHQHINIQVVDNYTSIIYDIIKEILSKLDYETSNLFIEMYEEKISKIKSLPSSSFQPVEERLEEAKQLSEKILPELK